MIATEMRNPKTMHIDRATTREMLEMINEENYNSVKAVEAAIPEIEKAVDALPATECMAIKCRYLFDMTIFKVAAEMNYSESQVKRIIKSGLARLEAEK
jgi:DNA-directed RNA polymerase specialized sigma subunit